MSNELVKANTSLPSLNWEDSKILATMKATIAQGLNDSEVQVFARFSQSTGLNPFKREVWAIKVPGYRRKDGTFTEDKVQIMTGINGYHAIANNHPNYDGMEVGLIGRTGEYLPLTYPGKDFVGAWCRVYRKDRRIPMEGVAFLSEYAKSSGNWNQMPRVMIQKCAESVALRKAFPQELNGTYTAEEMPNEYSEPGNVIVVNEEPATKPQSQSMKEIKESFFGGSNDMPAMDAVPPEPSSIDFSSFKYRYHIPPKKEGKDMTAVLAWLKRKKFRFNVSICTKTGSSHRSKISRYANDSIFYC